MTEHDPNGLSLKTPGAKADAGKPQPRRGALQYFPRALIAVAELSCIGADKYDWDGWRHVEDGVRRYGEAATRHVLKEAIEGPYDTGPGGTGILHAAAEAWNALARLELMLAAGTPLFAPAAED